MSDYEKETQLQLVQDLVMGIRIFNKMSGTKYSPGVIDCMYNMYNNLSNNLFNISKEL